MKINAVSSTIKPIHKTSFKSDNDKLVSKNPQVSDEFVSDKNKSKKKKKSNIWTYIAIGALAITVIADIIVEHKIRVDDKAKKEALQKEKELAEKLKKEAEEKVRQLEKEIKEKEEAIERAMREGKSGSDSKPPEINI